MDPFSLVTRDVCNGFAGNSDIYGLGIRIGIYLQWISSLLTNVFLPNGVSDSLDTNSIFLFAIFIATVNATAQSGQPEKLHPTEAFLMLQLCFGFLLSVLSVSGFRLALLKNVGPESFLSKLRFRPEILNASSAETQKHTDIPAILKSQSPLKTPRSQLNAARPTIPFRINTEELPSGLSIPAFESRLFHLLNALIVASVSPGAVHSSYGSIFTSSLESTFRIIDHLVLLRLASFSADDTVVDPVKLYQQQQLLNYKWNRKLAMDLKNPLISFGLKSTYKDDQVSWMGIAWRSFHLAGISIYNVWFWFTGIEVLNSDSCPSYVFLFYKANMLGGARPFFKVVAVIHIVCGAAILFPCCCFMLAFFGTTIRSIFTNLFMMPYAKMLLFLVQARTDSERAKRRLERFDAACADILEWMDIPNVRQLLCGFAYLSSNPKEAMEEEAAKQCEDATLRKNIWATRLKVFFLVTTLAIVIWTIITVELTLVYNSISGVYTIESTGQLIPFIIGIAGIGKTVNSITIEKIKKTYPDWSSIAISLDATGGIVIRDTNDAEDELPLPGEASLHHVNLQERVSEDKQNQKERLSSAPK